MDALLASKATLIFLVANLALSFFAFNNETFGRWGVLNTSAVFRNQEYHRVLVSGFLHADPMHLLFNMITLFFFGPSVELVLGSQSFFLIYLGALLGGSFFALWRNRANPNYTALGASGAISGILFVFCLFDPYQFIFVFFIPVPIILYAVFFVIYSLYGMGAQRDNIGHDAHLAGAVCGVTVALCLYPSLLGIFLTRLADLPF